MNKLLNIMLLISIFAVTSVLANSCSKPCKKIYKLCKNKCAKQHPGWFSGYYGAGKECYKECTESLSECKNSCEKYLN